MFRSLNRAFVPLCVAVPSAAFYFSCKSTNTASTTAGPTQIPEFTKLTVKKVVQETPDVKCITFALPDRSRCMGIEAISTVMVKAQVAGEAQPIMKPYNPFAHCPGEFSLCVKKYGDNAKMGGAIHGLNVGDSIEVKFGWQQFPYKANQFKEISCIAGGTGATPLLQLTEQIMANPADKTRVNFIFANKSDGDIFYKKQLDTLSKTYPDRLKVVYAVESIKPEFFSTLPYPSRGIVGKVTKEVVHDHVHSAAAQDSIVLVCGPGGMLNSLCGPKLFPKDGPPQQGPLLGILKDCGFTSANVFKV